MRIVAGDFRGRSLAAPSGQSIRPTTDRVRESLFNIIQTRWPERLQNARIIDLFAGTGALGLEALSRGGSFALFVETRTEGRGLIRKNIESLGLTGLTKVMKRDATRLGARGTIAPFDLAFADPPYGQGLGERAFAGLATHGWLKPGALIILEEKSGFQPAAIQGLKLLDKRRFGDTEMGFFERVHDT